MPHRQVARQRRVQLAAHRALDGRVVQLAAARVAVEQQGSVAGWSQAMRKKRISTRSGKRAPVPMKRLCVIQASAGCETSKVGAQRK